MHSNIGEELYQDGHKLKIININDKTIELNENINLIIDDYHKIEWCFK